MMKENSYKTYCDLPTNLSHKPVCYVDFQGFKLNVPDLDGEYVLDKEDAKYYSIGLPKWRSEDKKDSGNCSIKIFRTCMDDENRWSPQAEELPISRVLNMTLVFLSAIYEDSSIFTDSVNSQRSHRIKIRSGFESYFEELKQYLEDFPENKVLLKEIKRILNSRKDL